MDHANVLWKGCSTAHKEYQTEAMKTNFVLKTERFQALNMQAKINKILKDEEKAKKILNEKLKEQDFLRDIIDQKMRHQMMVNQSKNEKLKNENTKRMMFE